LDSTFPNLEQEAEYKFIIKEKGYFIRWEEGRNHVLNLTEVQRLTAEGLKSRGITNIKDIHSSLSELELSRTKPDSMKIVFGSKLLQVKASWHA
jgi:hypothetical protein